jgi:hypothetical protein
MIDKLLISIRLSKFRGCGEPLDHQGFPSRIMYPVHMPDDQGSAREEAMPDGHNRGARRAEMKVNRFMPGVAIVAIAAILSAGFLVAQSSPPPKAVAPAANLNQLMRALFFPNSNTVFFTQRYDPAEVKRADEPSGSTDPLTGVFGGWEAVENSALTLADSADLLLTPGRKCSNGRDVPIGNADWAQLVNGLRDASMVSYKAALTKDRDKLIMASEVLALSCSNCHNKYRPGNSANRCR